MFIIHIYLQGSQGPNLFNEEVDLINQHKHVEASSTSTNEAEFYRNLLSLPWHHKT